MMISAFAETSSPTRTTVILAPTFTNGLRGNNSHHGGGDGDGGDTLQEWSSLIGIVTAIVGNVLIALALNVQRYAHTRLHKERNLIRRRARAALKRTQTSGRESGTYGTILDGPENDQNEHSNGSAGTLLDSDDDCEDDRDYHEDDPLTASFQSGSTTAGTESEDGTDARKPTGTYLKSPYWWLGQILITLGEMGNFLAYGFAPASIVSPLGVVALISNCIIAPAMFHEKFRHRDFWGVVIAVSGVVTVVLSAKQEETKLGPDDVWGAITTMAFEIYMGVTFALIVALMWASRRYGKRTILIDLGLVGLFGGYTALSTKGVSSMLSSTLWGAFKTPVTYVLVLVLLVTAIMQIRYVNKALQRFDSTQVIPIQFVMFTLSVIVGSAVLFRDFEKTTAEQAAKFIGGCLLTFFGVFLITTGREHKDDEDFLSEADGIEETIGLTQHDGGSSFPPYQDDPTPKTRSRRSSKLSRVSFAGAVKPESSRDGAGVQSLRYPEANSSPIYLHEQAEALVSNPWQNSWEPSSSPPRGIRTISADSMATRSTLGLTPIHSHSTTPTKEPQMPPTYSTDRPVTPRGHSHKSSVHHRSRTFISPSPLSSTVTTVVKDAFLREGDGSIANRSSIRRTLRSSIRASLYFDDDDEIVPIPEQAIIPTSDDNLVRSTEITESEISGDTIRTRSRSLSDAIGEFFRPKKDSKESGLVSDGEADIRHSP